MAGDEAHAYVMGDESEEAKTKEIFLECLRLIERLHRRLLDVLRAKLEEAGKTDLNSVQALLLYNIGEHEITAGELRSRGYYLGSNVSYNLKKLVEMGYVSHERAKHDRRSVRVALTAQGREIEQLIDRIYNEQLKEIIDDDLFSGEDFRALKKNLKNLERYWADQLRYI